jgi:uncharacterized RDD family membrane protein YckC
VAEVKPPPFTLPPAGFWWRSLAFLADFIPLIVIGLFIAGQLANDEQAAARAKSDQYQERLLKLYEQALTQPSSRAQSTLMNTLLHPAEDDIQAYVDWHVYQGEVCFFVMLLGLFFQEWLWRGQTLGKRIFNLRTVDHATQAPPTLMACLLRSFWKAAFVTLYNPLTIVIGLINFHVPLFRYDRRSWHDMLSRTYVIDAKQSRTQQG